VSRQLSLHQLPVVVALDEQRLHQVDRHRALGQGQHLHLRGGLWAALLNDGLHQQARALKMMKQKES